MSELWLRWLTDTYDIIVDFLLEDKIGVELKSVIQLEAVHLAQAINYLEAYHLEVGLLINFGARKLEFKRVVNTKYRDDS